MNKERVLLAAEWVEQNEWFNMSNFYAMEYRGEYNTACCIAGTIIYRANLPGENISMEAGVWLGLTPRQARELFLPEDKNGVYNATGAQAAQVLRYFAETGEVDWSIIQEPAG